MRSAYRRAAQVSLLVANLVFVTGIASPHSSKSLVPLIVSRVIPKQAKSGPDLREVLRTMDKSFSQQIEYLHAQLDEATVWKPKSVKLEFFL